jgi:hypothetical protein
MKENNGGVLGNEAFDLLFGNINFNKKKKPPPKKTNIPQTKPSKSNDKTI